MLLSALFVAQIMAGAGDQPPLLVVFFVRPFEGSAELPYTQLTLIHLSHLNLQTGSSRHRHKT